MGGEQSGNRTILVVEDEDHVAELFIAVLSEHYNVKYASNGEEALEELDEDVDVVLLDRRMPKMSGDRALEHIESRDIDCRVAMISAIEPDFDVIDMGFDDYLVKPVENEELLATVEGLLALNEYEETYQELSSKLVKKNVIEVEKSQEELDESDEFEQLQAEIEELEAELDRMRAKQGFDERLLPS